MPFHRRVIETDKTHSDDAATYVKTLPARGALSALKIHATMTNGATGGRAVSMLDVIDTIEVVANGDRPIISLNSDELLRWQRYWSKNFGQLTINEGASAVQEWQIVLPFGRFIGDPNFFLPLDERHRDAEVRIAYSPSIAADGGFATGTFSTQIVGYMQDSIPGGYNGFFRTLTKKSFTSVASGDENLELPLGNPYRAIMIYAHESGVAMHTDITDIELQLNDGAIIWLKGETEDLCWENNQMLDLDAVQSGHYFSQAAETFETYLDYIKALSIVPGAVATIGTSATPLKLITSLTGGLVTPQGILKDGDGTQGADIAENADEDYYVRAEGVGLGKAVVIPFDDYIEQGVPWNSANYSKVNLILTQGGAGAQVRVSLSELVQQV